MEDFYAHVDNISNFIWGGTWNGEPVLPLAPMVVMLLGVGLYFMIRLKFLPIRRLFPAFGNLFTQSRQDDVDPAAGGAITPWNALSTALSGQVGTGNLAGVATALSLGGPGAIFWMWVTAAVGMAASFAESSLAVKYRETHADGSTHGGPMYYIKNGLGKGWTWLAVFFAIGTVFSAIVTGNMTQANSVATAITSQSGPLAKALPCIATEAKTARMISGAAVEFSVPGCDYRAAVEGGRDLVVAHGGQEISIASDQFTEYMGEWLPGVIIAALAFVVIIGGIKSIGSVAGKIVPAMALGYIAIALVMVALNIEHVPAAFAEIFTYAFGFEQAAGGAAGYAVLSAIRYGVARGLFSNEAGQGSTAIAHAASKTNDPVFQGEIAMLGAFIDTIVICTMTALVILTVDGQFASGEGVVEYAWQSSTLQGAQVTTAVFGHALPDVTLFGEVISPGGIFIAVALALFAFTTIIGWSYYMEQASAYLLGDWTAKPVRYIWVVMVFIGALQPIDFIWRFGDISNAAMAFPNLIAIIFLSPVVIAMAKEKGRI